MTLANQDLGTDDDPFIAGDDKLLNVYVEDGDEPGMFDLTGCSVEYYVVEFAGQTPILEKSTGDGTISIIDAEGGWFQVELDGSDTADLADEYIHRAKVTDAGETSHAFTGTLTITP